MAQLGGLSLAICLRPLASSVGRAAVASPVGARSALRAGTVAFRPSSLSTYPRGTACASPILQYAFSTSARTAWTRSPISEAAQKSRTTLTRPDRSRTPASSKVPPASPKAKPAPATKHSSTPANPVSEALSTTEHVTRANLTDDPMVLYRGGPASPSVVSDVLGILFFFGSLFMSYMVINYMPWPLPGFGFDIKDPEKSSPAASWVRASVATVLVSVGTISLGYFIGLQARTITRMTLYPKSGLVAVRTCKPSFHAFLPKRLTDRSKHGLDHPLATVDGRLGSKPDKYTRVFELDKIFTHLNRSQVQYYLLNDLRPHEQEILGGLLPKRRTRSLSPKAKQQYTTKESADKDDMTFLVVRPYRVMWGLRASGGRPEANTGSKFMTFWRKMLLPRCDYGDVSPKEAVALRAKGDHYLGLLIEAYAKRNRIPVEQVQAQIMPQGLDERQVWFRNRSNFDALFPTV